MIIWRIYFPDDVTDPIGSELRFQYQDNKSSRKEWEQTYTQGLDLLGFKYENRTEPFQGASGATHPVLAEAVTQFQATAYKELCQRMVLSELRLWEHQTQERLNKRNGLKIS